MEEEGSLDPAGMPSQGIFDSVDLIPRCERKLRFVGFWYAVVGADPDTAVPQEHGPHVQRPNGILGGRRSIRRIIDLIE